MIQLTNNDNEKVIFEAETENEDTFDIKLKVSLELEPYEQAIFDTGVSCSSEDGYSLFITNSNEDSTFIATSGPYSDENISLLIYNFSNNLLTIPAETIIAKAVAYVDGNTYENANNTKTNIENIANAVYNNDGISIFDDNKIIQNIEFNHDSNDKKQIIINL